MGLGWGFPAVWAPGFRDQHQHGFSRPLHYLCSISFSFQYISPKLSGPDSTDLISAGMFVLPREPTPFHWWQRQADTSEHHTSPHTVPGQLSQQPRPSSWGAGRSLPTSAVCLERTLTLSSEDVVFPSLSPSCPTFPLWHQSAHSFLQYPQHLACPFTQSLMPSHPESPRLHSPA